MRKIALLTLASALALSACNRKPAEEPQPANNVIEVPEETIPANEAETTEVPNNTAAVVKPAPPPSVSETQQMQDDADATGLTARLPDDSSGVPTNQVRQGE